MNTFPRQPAHAGWVPVQFKRKKGMKNVVLKPRMVNVKRLEQALKYFKESGLPSYQEITIDENYDPEFVFDDVEEENMGDVMDESSQQIELDGDKIPQQDTPEPDEDDCLEAVKAFQSKNTDNCLMADEFPGMATNSLLLIVFKEISQICS